MRRFVLLVVSAALGVGGAYVYQHYRQPAKDVTTPPPGTAGALSTAAVEPAAPPGPILGEEPESTPEVDRPVEVPEPLPESRAVPAVVATPPAKEPAPRPTEKNEPPPPIVSAPTPRSAAADVEVGERIQLAKAAFDAGDSVRGVKLLRDIFRAAKDRSDVDILPQARQLLEVEERGAQDRPAQAVSGEIDPDRLDLYKYLAARDRDPAYRFKACYALGSYQARQVEPEPVRAAWENLTAAYLAASTPAQRKQVMAVLGPFLTKHLFSKRFSPLIISHTVKAGESLHLIAKARKSTEEAIQHLNRITGDVIHPGQRLILLEGKVKIFIKKSEFRLWALIGDRLFLEAPVGLGRDNSTPAATFVVQIRQKDPVWYRRGEPPLPPGDPRNILGSRWLGFKETADFTGFGLHGTLDPASIGKEESSGCIRMHNRDIEVLWDFTPLGTEVEVVE